MSIVLLIQSVVSSCTRTGGSKTGSVLLTLIPMDHLLLSSTLLFSVFMMEACFSSHAQTWPSFVETIRKLALPSMDPCRSSSHHAMNRLFALFSEPSKVMPTSMVGTSSHCYVSALTSTSDSSFKFSLDRYMPRIVQGMHPCSEES